VGDDEMTVMPPTTAAPVIVIGGGPAGAAAAFHLARAGVQVSVIESKTFPRIKVCGEYISPAATDLLEAIIPAAELVRLGARQVDQFVIEVGERRREWRTPRAAWAVSRAVLDEALLEKARGVGATVLQPASVRGVEYGEGGAVVELADGRRLEASLVIHADGSGRHDPSGPAPNAPGLIGHKCHLRVPRGTVEGVTMRSCAGAYVGTIEVEGGLSTCAMVARRELSARFNGDVDAMLAHLWPPYRAAWRASDWKSCGVGRSGYVKPGHFRSLRIGNAAAAVDPVGGEGIGLALWSGTELAGLVAAATQSKGLEVGSLVAVERQLARAYGQRLRTRLPACRLVAGALLRPHLFALLWPLLGLPSVSIGPWYRLSGKPAV
jgi:flavin-dependent dehydrogenase